MHEMPVSGEIKTIAAREGSSGIFTGTLEGMYQGYRFASTTPDEREYVLEANDGNIALLLRQQIVTPLPPRFPEHPFRDGRDPFEDPSELFAQLGPPPPGMGPQGGHGGPPGGAPGGPPAGGPPGGAPGGPPGEPPGGAAGGPPGATTGGLPGAEAGGAPGGPPGTPGGVPGGPPGGPPGAAAAAPAAPTAEHPGAPGAAAAAPEEGEPKFDPFKRIHYIETKLHMVPEKSTGIFAGAFGEMEIFAPQYRMRGRLLLETKDGDLELDFLEWSEQGTLTSDLWVNGAESTGIFENAEGQLKFALTVTPPFFGRGPYSGVIRLQQARSTV